MASAVNIVINDGAATPVAHTFTPIGRDDKGVLWFEQTTPAPINPMGAKRIGYKQTRMFDAKGQLTSVSRMVLTLALPSLEVLGNAASGLLPPATLAYVEKFRLDCDLPERGLLQERKDTRVLFSNLLANAQIVSAVDSLQPMY